LSKLLVMGMEQTEEKTKHRGQSAALVLNLVSFPGCDLFSQRADTAALNHTVKLPVWGLRTVFAHYAIPYEWAASTVESEEGEADNRARHSESVLPALTVTQPITPALWSAHSITQVYQNLTWISNTLSLSAAATTATSRRQFMQDGVERSLLFTALFKTRLLKEKLLKTQLQPISKVLNHVQGEISVSLLPIGGQESSLAVAPQSQPGMSDKALMGSLQDSDTVQQQILSAGLFKRPLRWRAIEPDASQQDGAERSLLFTALFKTRLFKEKLLKTQLFKTGLFKKQLQPISKVLNHVQGEISVSLLPIGGQESSLAVAPQSQPGMSDKAFMGSLQYLSQGLGQVQNRQGPIPDRALSILQQQRQAARQSWQRLMVRPGRQNAHPFQSILPQASERPLLPGNKHRRGDFSQTIDQPVQQLIQSLARQNQTQTQQQDQHQEALTTIQRQVLESGQANHRELQGLRQAFQELKTSLMQPRAALAPRSKPPLFYGPL
jgi:hypothetical protein